MATPIAQPQWVYLLALLDSHSRVTIRWPLLADYVGYARRDAESGRRMRFPPWIFCLWPGLPKLWLQSKLSALLVAVVFAGFLQGMMLTSFVWTGLASPAVRTMGWLIAGFVWFVSTARELRRLPYLSGRDHRDQTDALFREAQTEYLKGNWYQAQALLEQILRHNAGDVDAGLMLASLYRHVGRWEEASEQLRQLDRFELSARWRLEIQKEREHLDRLESEPNNVDEDPVSTSSLTAGTTSEAA